MMKVGLLGYGYTASFFAELLSANGYQVWGTSRNIADLHYSVAPNVEIINFAAAEITNHLTDTSCLLISTPPTKTGLDPSLDLLQDTLIAHKKHYQWIGYLSSTGVYGDHQGQWVNENSLCHPKTTRAQNRLLIEKHWLSLWETEKLPVMVFRLSGIYGPGRNALQRAKTSQNTTIFKPGQYFSRIHVTDICQALFNAMLSPMPGETFNLSDDYPCNTPEVASFAANLLQLEQPNLIPYQEAAVSPTAREFYANNKRISNTKLKSTILPQLAYPTYKEGLSAIFSAEYQPE